MDQDRDFTREPIGRFEWERILRRIQVSSPSVKLVGFTMATYADADGCRVRPGQSRLAAVLGTSISTVRRGQSELEELGMLDMVAKGRSYGRGHQGSFASEYRLTVPSDLLESVPMLDPDEQNNMAPMHGSSKKNRAPVQPSSSELPVISAELPVTGEELPVISAELPVTHEHPPQHSHHNKDHNKEQQSVIVAKADAQAREQPEEIDANLLPEAPLSKAALAKQLAEDFSDWYAVYPKHVGRGAAVNAYTKARKNGATAEELIAGATRYATERKREDPKFTKMPATWLNQECWADEPNQTGANPWTPEYHSPVPPQYAWANLPARNSSEKRMMANLEVLDGWNPGPKVDVFEQKANEQQEPTPEIEDKSA
ncbi:helix-turn-helix domain-containing protein [Arthrobacter sp. StoSoilB22]|uniref:helix-turn-helix domain-containing protein n=1 Tax=Arthrobacter sp. StoSoilB22 TaxID=2830996 RepID=UPI001CC7E76D|nr:helix-turn-helix domain-containing protein [Arthrobacter sp. StoSoilB22]BCW62466.1 hypothetical protein StoSoilB22_14390 [Arthrobacter sp. StoSoilB22]